MVMHQTYQISLTYLERQKCYIELILQAAKDAEEKTEGVVAIPASDSSKEDIIKAVVENVKWQMDKDRKSTALKALQGHIWKEGYSQEKLNKEELS
jgi:methionine salvage enolase-phosphatase E1